MKKSFKELGSHTHGNFKEVCCGYLIIQSSDVLVLIPF